MRFLTRPLPKNLSSSKPTLGITFVSYGVGAATLKELGQEVVDLGLPEDNPLWDTLLRIAPVLQERRPAW